MTEPKATARPWVYHSGMIWKPVKHNQFPDGTETGMPIARMDCEPGNGTTPAERDANGRFICVAVNSHEGLLDAAKNFLRRMESLTTDEFSVGGDKQEREALKDAVEKAEERRTE